MKVLIVSSFEAGSSAIGAQRTQALAGYLHGRGHDAIVVGALREGRPALLGAGDLAPPHEDLSGGVKARPSTSAVAPGHLYSSVRRRGGRAVRAIVDWPDPKRERAWFAGAVRLVRERAVRSRFDVVVSSGPPWVCHKLGRGLAVHHGTPWIPDYRDLWTNGPYYPHPASRRPMEMRLEKRWLRHARAITAVTPGLTDALGDLSSAPRHTIWNGFTGNELSSMDIRDLGPAPSIVYAGSWYAGKRDVRPVLDAMASGGGLDAWALHLVGDVPADVVREIDARGLGDRVVLHGSVVRSEALSIVGGADIALVLGWNDPRDRDVVGGKVFELIGMKKPIIAVAYPHGVLATVIERYGLGRIANSGVEVASAVAALCGSVSRGIKPDPRVVKSFEREVQMERWEALIEVAAESSEHWLGGSGAPAGAV